jgi:hypothetical protein
VERWVKGKRKAYRRSIPLRSLTASSDPATTRSPLRSLSFVEDARPLDLEFLLPTVPRPAVVQAKHRFPSEGKDSRRPKVVEEDDQGRVVDGEEGAGSGFAIFVELVCVVGGEARVTVQLESCEARERGEEFVQGEEMILQHQEFQRSLKEEEAGSRNNAPLLENRSGNSSLAADA